MTDAGTFLINCLRRVIDGGDATNDEFDAVISDPAGLRGAERKAWHGQRYWADDDDVRANDPAYAAASRVKLADLLIDLEREKELMPNLNRPERLRLCLEAGHTRGMSNKPLGYGNGW